MTALSDPAQPSTRRLFAVYAAVSLVPVLVLGLVLSSLLHRQATRAGLSEGASEARVVARSSIAPLLDGHDLRQGLPRGESAALNAPGRPTPPAGPPPRARNAWGPSPGVGPRGVRFLGPADNVGLGTVDDEAEDA